MNVHDADAAAAAVDPDIEIHVGPHVMIGVHVIREFALQDDPLPANREHCAVLSGARWGDLGQRPSGDALARER